MSRLGVALRVGIYAALCIAVLLVAGPVFYSITDSLIAAVLSTFTAAAAANSLALRIYERRTLTAVGLGWTGASMRHLFFGLAGGGGAAAFVLGAPMAFGLARWEPAAGPVVGWGGLFYVLFLLLFGVVGEELLFRGYGFQALFPVLGEYATLLPMGVIFAVAHSGNQNISYLALFNTFAWGVLLGWAVLRSGDLWLAIGLHAGWNWGLPLLGFNLSGFTMKLSGRTVVWNASDVISGGEYGPEGGVLCLAALAILIAALVRAPIQPQHLALRERSSSASLPAST